MDEKYLKYKQKYLSKALSSAKTVVKKTATSVSFAASKAIGKDTSFKDIQTQIQNYKSAIKRQFDDIKVVSLNDLNDRIKYLEGEITKYIKVRDDTNESVELLKIAITEYLRRMKDHATLGEGITKEQFDEVLQSALLIDFFDGKDNNTEAIDAFAKYDSGELLQYITNIRKIDIFSTLGAELEKGTKIEGMKQELVKTKNESVQNIDTISKQIQKLDNIIGRLKYLVPALKKIKERKVDDKFLLSEAVRNEIDGELSELKKLV
jgi:hypothetical protein